MFYQKFLFNATENDGTHVATDALYSDTAQYGFVRPGSPQDNRIFPGNGGWLATEKLAANLLPQQNENGVSLTKARLALCFGICVPEQGNYQVAVTIQAAETDLNELNLYYGRRQLVREHIHVAAQQQVTIEFYAHVGAYYQAVGTTPVSDNTLYVSILGLDSPATLSAISIKEATVPTLYLAGDSIVADNEAKLPYVAETNGCGWGQVLTPYFKLAVDNQAHNGMTTTCFRDDGHWQLIEDSLQAKDIVLFHFGHNDQKRRALAAYGGYSANLRGFVKDVRAKGALPVLVTSLSRVPKHDKDGDYDLLEEYAQAVLRVGKELAVPVIDLHQFSFKQLCALQNQVDLTRYFNDAAHTNDYSALLTANWLVRIIAANKIAPLYDYLSAQPTTLALPKTQPVNHKFANEQPISKQPILSYRDTQFLPPALQNELQQALQLHLIDPCVRYLHPYATMPRGQFLYLFAAVAKPFTQSGYLGKYNDVYRYEWDAAYVQAAIDANLIDPATITADRIRLDDPLTGQELISFVIRNLQPLNQRELSLRACEKIAAQLGLLWSNYNATATVDRLTCLLTVVHATKV